MPKVLMCYDVSGNYQTEVKAGLIAIGYQDYIDGNIGVSHLPETTLYKYPTTTEQVVEDIKGVIAAINETIADDTKEVTLQRFITAEISDWQAIPGIPHM